MQIGKPVISTVVSNLKDFSRSPAL